MYQLLDYVSKYTHHNTTLRSYADGYKVLSVFFRYKEELPAGTILRITQVDDVKASFGEAVIGPANLEGTGDDLLSAKIFTSSMPDKFQGFRVVAIAPDGSQIFEACFFGADSIYGDLVRELLNGYKEPITSSPMLSPVPPGYGNSSDYDILDDFRNPAPTPYHPFYNNNNWNSTNGTSWIEDGMQINPPSSGGFFW